MFKLPSYWIYRRQKGTYRPIIYVFGFNEQLVRDMLLSLEVNIGVSDDGDDVCYISRKHQSKVLEHNDEIQAIYSDTRAGGRA